jgi:uncharacterized membrane protein YhaH (DUF805 family)
LLLVATFIPSLAVGIRRLHDTDRTGWWLAPLFVLEAAALYFLSRGDLMTAGIVACVALVYAIVLIIFMAMEGTKGANKYGPDPKAMGGDTAVV